jgi:adenylate cyclase class 2
MSQGNLETEIKLPVTSLEETRRRIDALGFRLKTPRTFESNVLHDTRDATLRGRGCLLRLRETAGNAILTYKGPGQEGKHKVREELEVSLSEAQAASLILQRLGYHPVFRYEKYRTEYTDGAGILTLDETPIGCYLELEGSPQWIDEAAEKLGYQEQDYITKSYGALYLSHCQERNILPTNMVFRDYPEGAGTK